MIRIWLILLLVSPVWAQPALSVMGNPRQGEPLFVSVKGVAPGVTGVLRFANERFELAPADSEGVMRTVAAIPVDLAAGPHPMIAELSDGARVERSVTTTRRAWPAQSIWLPAATMAGYDDPQNKADDEAILEALKPFVAERLWKGSWSLPINEPQGTGFGEKRVYNGGVKRSYHKGLDLSGWEGEEVHAPAAGVVLHTASGVVNGNTIVIGHGLGLGTSYFHLSSIDVEEGESVAKGQVIGRVGGTGGFAPHLHWEVRVHGIPVEPHALLALPAGWR